MQVIKFSSVFFTRSLSFVMNFYYCIMLKKAIYIYIFSLSLSLIKNSRATNETDRLIMSVLITKISRQDQSCFITHSTLRKECAITFDIILLIVIKTFKIKRTYLTMKHMIY